MARPMLQPTRRILHAVEIDRDAATCWKAFGRVSEWPLWFPMLTSVDRSRGDDDFIVGETLDLHLSFAGRGARVPVRVEEVGPMKVRWRGRSYGVTGDHAFHVEALDGGRARFVSEERFSGLPVRLLPASVFASLERETTAGLSRFRDRYTRKP